MGRAFLFGSIGAAFIFTLVFGTIQYMEGAPIGVEGIVVGGIIQDENGQLVVIPDQPIPDSAINMVWSEEYLMQSQFRQSVDTFSSTMYPLLLFLTALGG